MSQSDNHDALLDIRLDLPGIRGAGLQGLGGAAGGAAFDLPPRFGRKEEVWEDKPLALGAVQGCLQGNQTSSPAVIGSMPITKKTAFYNIIRATHFHDQTFLESFKCVCCLVVWLFGWLFVCFFGLFFGFLCLFGFHQSVNRSIDVRACVRVCLFHTHTQREREREREREGAGYYFGRELD